MKSFVVIGLGRFGTAVAEELYALGHEVLAIDREEGCAQRVSEIVTHTITPMPKTNPCCSLLECAILTV